MYFTHFFQTRRFFVIVLIVVFLFEALLISYRNAEEIIQASTSDEALFLLDTTFTRFIETLDPNVLHVGFPGPYGHPFWLLLATIKKGAELCAFPIVLAATLIFLAMKYIAVIFWREALALRLDGDSANVLALALLASPGLFFYGKIISPEFQALAFVSAGTYFVARTFMQDGTMPWLGLTLLFLATYIKISNLPFFAAAWLATGIFAYRSRGTRDALRILSISTLIFVAAALLACAVAGGLSVTVESITMLPTPPADFRIDHLWHNLMNAPSYTWDQVKLLPLWTGFPILFVAILVAIAPAVLQLALRHRIVLNAESPFLWLQLASAFAMLTLLLAKSMNYSWYLFVPAITASLTLFMLAGPSLKRRNILVVAALVIIVAIPTSIQNVEAEMRKRALLLDAAARSGSLVATAHELCRGGSARIILDMLIPVTENLDQRVLILRDAVRMADMKDDLARKQPILFISHEQMFTDYFPANALLIQPAHARFEIIRHPAHAGYLFHVGEGCRQQ